jgi:putative DNA primase/helicase
MEIMEHVLGDYARTTPAATLAPHRNEHAPRNDLARLVGARLVTAHETDLKRGVAESVLKHITGGDRLSARFLHKEFFEYKPEFTLWITCNNRPLIHGTDLAIWDRLPLVPFEASFRGEREDKQLMPKLQAESPGILNRFVRGCLVWQREGLLPQPDCIRAASSAYRTASNPIAPFLETCCTYDLESPPDEKIGDSLKTVYAAYTAYMNRVKEKPEKIAEFSAQMEAFGFVRDRRNRRAEGKTLRFWRGVLITTDDPDDFAADPSD